MGVAASLACQDRSYSIPSRTMAPKAMKAMVAAKSISKSGLADAVAGATEMKKSECMKVITSLAEVVTKELRKTGKVMLPGIAMLKTRKKPATKAGKREMFGQVVMVKAKPAKTVVKAFPAAAIKREF